MLNIAVILSGCGYLDGSEIRESVLLLAALDKAGAQVQCYAPDMLQGDVVDHLSREAVEGESRNVLIESARIARGDVHPLSEMKVELLDALCIPGGYGVAKSLSDLAFKGAGAVVDPDFQSLILDFLEAGKPIGVICIAPAVLMAAVQGKYTPTLTIGNDEDGLIESMGGVHQMCATDQCVVDHVHKIVSTSAYMREARLADVQAGIEALVSEVVSLS